MNETNKEIWVKKGYELFAINGLNGIKIEPLARLVGKNKSSFYHYFADQECFVEELLNHHLKQSEIVAQKEKLAQSIHPELIQILIEHQTDILFNKQLRFNRDQKHFKSTLAKSNEIIGKDFVLLWLKELQLNISLQQIESLFELALENFFLQITPENFNESWLNQYFDYLKNIIRKFVQAG